VDAVASKLVRRDIPSEAAGSCDLGQRVPDQIDELLLHPADVLASMQHCRELPAVVLTAVKRIGLEYRFEPLVSVAGLVAKLPGWSYECVWDDRLGTGVDCLYG
jgi:hypothetical protein